MLMLLVELVAERVKQDPVPVNLMGVLAMAFNPDNEYHFKNRMKACQRNWAEVFGDEANMFAVSPSNTYQKVRLNSPDARGDLTAGRLHFRHTRL
ncbi:ubiquitin carboxyl-terminal hydrolase 24-like [Hippocampus comes]|uniref:ubiquitin carboxyl-terminal hydrolase 24-like n=1 Tax=Hippocampus comes TaxID=109280 RepID=UPI00094EE3DD|nr:PREDICTED: ubiquitin carboxyl-terminal hydrolase 24-like [Hippocampus comes]